MRLPRKVYAIQHNVTKRIYIGSSCDVQNRYRGHINDLKKHKHSVEDMQKDFDTYGEDFTVYILDEITDFTERHKEYDWMLKYNTIDREKGYNYKDVFTTRFKSFRAKDDGNFFPLAEGRPDGLVDLTDERNKLHFIIEQLEDAEVVYASTFLTRMFKNGKWNE